MIYHVLVSLKECILGIYEGVFALGFMQHAWHVRQRWKEKTHASNNAVAQFSFHNSFRFHASDELTVGPQGRTISGSVSCWTWRLDSFGFRSARANPIMGTQMQMPAMHSSRWTDW